MPGNGNSLAGDGSLWQMAQNTEPALHKETAPHTRGAQGGGDIK